MYIFIYIFFNIIKIHLKFSLLPVNFFSLFSYVIIYYILLFLILM